MKSFERLTTLPPSTHSTICTLTEALSDTSEKVLTKEKVTHSVLLTTSLYTNFLRKGT